MQDTCAVDRTIIAQHTHQNAGHGRFGIMLDSDCTLSCGRLEERRLENELKNIFSGRRHLDNR